MITKAIYESIKKGNAEFEFDGIKFTNFNIKDGAMTFTADTVEGTHLDAYCTPEKTNSTRRPSNSMTKKKSTISSRRLLKLPTVTMFSVSSTNTFSSKEKNKMSYEEYNQEMDRLQKEFDRCASIDDYAGMDRIQQKMDRLTNAVAMYHTNQIKQKGW